jgi:hypothetical protein
VKRLAAGAAVLAAVTAALGCGSGGGEQSQLPRELGADLAGQSEGVGAALDEGKDCVAQRRANRLRTTVERSIDQERVPPELQAELRQRANRLADSIVCVPTPAAPPPPLETEEGDDDDGDESGKKGRGKKGKHEEDD